MAGNDSVARKAHAAGTSAAAPVASVGPASATALLKNPPFVCYYFARICSSVAFAMQGVAVGWHLYSLTGSALDLGLVGLAQFLPMVVLTLAVGHFADRYDRRRIVSLCQLVSALSAAVL